MPALSVIAVYNISDQQGKGNYNKAVPTIIAVYQQRSAKQLHSGTAEPVTVVFHQRPAKQQQL